MKLDIGSHRKSVDRFRLNLMFVTEGISYIMLVPVLLLYIGTNINLTSEQIILLLKCTLFAVSISIPTTMLTHVVVLKPISRVFRESLAGKEVDDVLYETAQRRFLRLPFINGVGSSIRWISRWLWRSCRCSSYRT